MRRREGACGSADACAAARLPSRGWGGGWLRRGVVACGSTRGPGLGLLELGDGPRGAPLFPFAALELAPHGLRLGQAHDELEGVVRDLRRRLRREHRPDTGRCDPVRKLVQKSGEHPLHVLDVPRLEEAAGVDVSADEAVDASEETERLRARTGDACKLPEYGEVARVPEDGLGLGLVCTVTARENDHEGWDLREDAGVGAAGWRRPWRPALAEELLADLVDERREVGRVGLTAVPGRRGRKDVAGDEGDVVTPREFSLEPRILVEGPDGDASVIVESQRERQGGGGEFMHAAGCEGGAHIGADVEGPNDPGLDAMEPDLDTGSCGTDREGIEGLFERLLHGGHVRSPR